MSNYTTAKDALRTYTSEHAMTALSMGLIFMGFDSYILKALAVGAYLLGAYIGVFLFRRHYRKFKRHLRLWRPSKA